MFRAATIPLCLVLFCFSCIRISTMKCEKSNKNPNNLFLIFSFFNWHLLKILFVHMQKKNKTRKKKGWKTNKFTIN